MARRRKKKINPGHELRLLPDPADLLRLLGKVKTDLSKSYKGTPCWVWQAYTGSPGDVRLVPPGDSRRQGNGPRLQDAWPLQPVPRPPAIGSSEPKRYTPAPGKAGRRHPILTGRQMNRAITIVNGHTYQITWDDEPASRALALKVCSDYAISMSLIDKRAAIELMAQIHKTRKEHDGERSTN